MDVVFTYLLFIGAGIAVGGAYSMFKTNKLASGILLALAILAAVAGILRL
ncbi:xanthosine utilization system XapX-like protein [Rhodococcus sp. 27YEA15]